VFVTEYELTEYDGLLGAGGPAAWGAVPGGCPRPRGYDGGYANVSCAMQILHRLLPVALWLERHAVVCGETEKCIVCALRKSRGLDQFGDLVKGRYKPAPDSWTSLTTAGYFEWLIEALRMREQAVACARIDCQGDAALPDIVTHVDRLFGQHVEERRQCGKCKEVTARSTFERVWRVSTGLHDADDATVTELFLRSCAVVEEEKPRYCAKCSVDTQHCVQKRLVALPNIMCVRIDRPRAMQVRAEDQLVLTLFGLENLQLAGVCYERGVKHSSCACRGVDGDFWYFRGGLEPLCSGQTVDEILPGRVAFVVYQRQGGAAGFGGASAVVPVAPAPERRVATASAAAVARRACPGEGQREPAGEGVSVTTGNLFWDAANRRTFAEMYYMHGGDARAALLFTNTIVGSIVMRLPAPAEVRSVVVDRVLAFLTGLRRPEMPSLPNVRLFGIFAVSLWRRGVSSSEFDRGLAADKLRREVAELASGKKRARADVEHVALAAQRRAAAENPTKVTKLSAQRAGGEAMQEGLIRGGLGDGRSSRDARGALAALGAASRAQAAEWRGIGDLAAARRLAKRSEGRELLDGLARGGRGDASKKLTAGEVARRAQAAEALRRSLALGAASSAKGKGGGASSGAASGGASAARGRVARVVATPRVDTWLIDGIPCHAIGQGLVAQVVKELGEVVAVERLNASWSGEWDGWTLLMGQIQELDAHRDEAVAELERQLAEAVAGDDDDDDEGRVNELKACVVDAEQSFMDDAMECVQDRLRQFFVLSNQNVPIPGRTDAAKLKDLRERAGLHEGVGKVWGRNDCCADSLLQLLIEYGILEGAIDASAREQACLANRNALWAGPDALQPKAFNGTPEWRAYLEVDRHAEATIRFFMDEYFRDKVQRAPPAAGFEIIVYTRFDTEDGQRPPLRLRICARAGSSGGPLRMHLYNKSGQGLLGYHYDPLFERPLNDDLAAIV
jgi:hypothetical protein